MRASTSREVGLLSAVVGLFSLHCAATPISVGDPYLQLYNVAVNSDGFASGQLIRFGAGSVVPNGANGTTGFATTTNLSTGAVVTRTINFTPSPVSPNFFGR